MKLDLRSREVKLPCGIAVRVRPLNLGEFQTLLGYLARGNDGNLPSQSDLQKLLLDTDALVNMQRLVDGALVSCGAFTVVTDAGERAGVFPDLLLGQPGLINLVTILSELLVASTLTEAEAKN